MSTTKPYPCPACGSDMTSHRVLAWTGHDMSFTYFMNCNACGRGPTAAYESEIEAINQWNSSLDIDYNGGSLPAMG